jgi:sugar phosphate isomerase/epimerase
MARHIADFGMDTITLAGPLAAKLRAIRDAGFGQVMLAARDLVGHPDGWRAAVQEVKASGLRVTGFQVLRDFEGLSGHLHDYKVDIARSMLEMCAALGSPVLLACSSEPARQRRPRRGRARPAQAGHDGAAAGHQGGLRRPELGPHINDSVGAWDVVQRADCPNLGLGIDSYHSFATETPLDALEDIDPAASSSCSCRTSCGRSGHAGRAHRDRAHTSASSRAKACTATQLQRLVIALDRLGYRGDYSFEVFNDDYQQLPLPKPWPSARRRAAVWLAEDVLRRAVPLPACASAAAEAPGRGRPGR